MSKFNREKFTLPKFVGHYIEEWETREPQDALSTGIDSLDEILNGGLAPGHIFTVGAETGNGKSAFGVNMARRVAAEGKPVCFFTFEMTVTALHARVNQNLSGVNSTRIQNKSYAEEETQCVADAYAYIKELPLVITTGSYLTPENMGDVMEIFVEEMGIELFVFDYIQVMAKGMSDAKQFKVEEVMCSIRESAKERVECPCLVLSQLNREAGKRGEPNIYDLRDSGAVENNSDIVGLLDPATTRPWHGRTGFSLKIVKQREGECGDVPLIFVPHKVEFLDGAGT